MRKDFLDYKGKIYDMGLKKGEVGEPVFYILTDEGNHLTIPIVNASNINFVCNFLKSISSGIHISFHEFKQFNDIIDRVFRQYCKNQTPEYYFDNTDLKRIMNDLGITGSDIVNICRINKYPIGKSTVYDLLEGVVMRPRFSTVCKIQKALFKTARIQAM